MVSYLSRFNFYAQNFTKSKDMITEKMIEEWRYIPNTNEMYMVSNLGRVKSLFFNKEKIMSPGRSKKGYLSLGISVNKNRRTFNVHQLVAKAFLGHKPDGTNKIVVDHIDNNPLNNNVNNLQLISNRENSSKDKVNGTSKYPGVSYDKERNSWRAGARINGKSINIGRFNTEEEAYKAYLKRVN
jgi:hypothetical protein